MPSHIVFTYCFHFSLYLYISCIRYVWIILDGCMNSRLRIFQIWNWDVTQNKTIRTMILKPIWKGLKMIYRIKMKRLLCLVYSPCFTSSHWPNLKLSANYRWLDERPPQALHWSLSSGSSFLEKFLSKRVMSMQ